MEIPGYIAAVLIGISLGLIGGGGSILTVPVLVYLFHVDPLLATTWSLFIVGITSLTGGIRAYVKKKVDFKTVSEFGIPSILSIFITRHYILPAIPEVLYTSGNFTVKKAGFLMLVFALLMLVAAIAMITSRIQHTENKIHESSSGNQRESLYLMLLGLLVGIITGLLGAGGGFLIVPALVLLIRLPMKIAIGTSLLIIAINSLFGFLFSLKHYEMNWDIILPFSLLAIAGLFSGSLIAERISGAKLKKGFGWFVLAMGICIVVKELFL
jgi:uncharacterized membrane protein YfcA